LTATTCLEELIRAIDLPKAKKNELIATLYRDH
jgi:hypothetical protein